MEHQLETLTACPSCGSGSLKDQHKSFDYTYSHDHFQIVSCRDCSLLFTNPRPEENAIHKYYDHPEYVSHTDKKDGLFFTIYSIVKQFTLSSKKRYITKLATDKTILDYGAGSGDFAIAMAKANWNVVAFEPNPSAKASIRSKSKDIKLISALSEVENSKLSIVSLWHVLEHVHQLKEVLQHFHRILKKDGYLIIAVPNHTSFDAKKYAVDWAAYDVPRHLYHFNPDSLTTLMSEAGFKLTQIKPMWFDSFYVSLLSEKNRGTELKRNPLIGWISAIWTGLLSNLNAIASPKLCSSLTYVFKKA